MQKRERRLHEELRRDLEYLRLNSILEGANRLEDEVVTEILNRAFIRGVALIFVFFIVLTLYRLLVRRFAPNLPPKPRADR